MNSQKQSSESEEKTVIPTKNVIPFNNSPGKIASLQEIIVKLRQVFQSDHIDVDYVQELLTSYNSNPRDWRKYCHFDRHR